MLSLEKESKKYIIVIITMWVVFIIWELFVFRWAQQIEGPIIRVDLIIILPALIGVTGYCIAQIIRPKNKYQDDDHQYIDDDIQ